MFNHKSKLLLATLAGIQSHDFGLLTNAHAAGLNDTGITTCSNATQNGLPCPVAGFPGQDAEFGTNSFNFTKLDANGNAMAVTATNHSCVQDNVTGLMWEVKTDDGGLRDKDNTYTWYNSNSTNGNLGIANGGYCSNFGRCDTEKFVQDVNATNLCGHNDWRLPELGELVSIVDYSLYATIDSEYFPNTVSEIYWTNTTMVENDCCSWVVDFSYSEVYGGYYSNRSFVRCVRAEQRSFSSFSDQSDGTVKDNNTGLVWAKCPLGQSGINCESGSATAMPWQQALQAADGLTLAGQSDWRLPNVKELQSLVDYTKYNSAISSTYFPNSPSRYFWTSSSFKLYVDSSWIVSFGGGGVAGNRNRTYYDFVRCVRTALTATVPTAITNAPSVITASTAKLGGTVTPNGAATSVTFDFGLTSAYGVSIPATPASIAATASATAVSATKTGLNCNSVYHYRVKATNSVGTSLGADKVLTTAICPVTVPVAVTNAATNLTLTSATLNGSVISAGSTATVTFNFGTTTNYGTNLAASPSSVYSSTAVAVTANKTGLTCGTTYHYRVTAVSSAGTGTGADQTFTTGICTYTVTPSLALSASGYHGTVSPSSQQRVTSGATTTFTLTPSAGYTKKRAVGGTCPKGNWSGGLPGAPNVWTTGPITANCSVVFDFDSANIVTPVWVPSVGGTVTPSIPQTLAEGETQAFTVIPNIGYVTNATVSGYCPQGSWNGNVWTTQAITKNCIVGFNFISTTAAPTTINDTGIKTCSNSTQNNLPCPIATHPIQDAEYGTDSFNFTKLDAAGNALPAAATNHVCVKDNVTSLMWEVKTDDNSLRDKDWTYTWYDSNPADGNSGTPNGGTCKTSGRCDTDKFVADVNAQGLCGYNDWRMPAEQELVGIVDYSVAPPGPTIDTNYFPNSLAKPFWIKSIIASGSLYSWTLDFTNSRTYSGQNRSFKHAVRLVRGKPFFAAFISNADGTVTDQSTGLMWAKCIQGYSGTSCTADLGGVSIFSWSNALTAARNSRLAGYSDWRLPNIKELQSIVDYSRVGQRINTTYFPNTAGTTTYWSSSPSTWAVLSSWTVQLEQGVVFDSQRGNVHEVRFVRGGAAAVTSFVVTPTAGTGGTIAPNTPQTVARGATQSFTLTINTGYTRNTAVGGTCPQGNWSGGATGSPYIWTTAPITANCTVIFSFTPNTYTVTPSVSGNGGTITPNTAQSVTHGATKTFTLAPNPGYTKNSTVGGTCPQGSWNGNIWTTGAIIANCTVSFSFTAPPDFVITGITLNPAAPVAGSTFTAVVSIKNQGVGAGNGGSLDLWTSQFSAPACGAHGTQAKTVGTLAAGVVKDFTFTGLAAGTAESKILGAFVDSACSTTEMNETNNQRSLEYRVPSRKPDFVVTAITVTPATPAANGNITLAVTVKNQGTLDGVGGFLDVWANQAIVPTCGTIGNQWKDVGFLAIGASATFNFALPAGAAGTKTARAFVDSWCETTESNEANNQMTKSYTVQ